MTLYDDIPLAPLHQLTFDELLDSYNQGHEPLENWTTDHLIRLMDAVDRELQSRGERIHEPEDLYVQGYDEWTEHAGQLMGEDDDE